MSTYRLSLLTFVVAISVLAAAPAGHAAQVSQVGNTLTVDEDPPGGGATETNTMTIAYQSGTPSTYLVTDATAPVTPGVGCVPFSGGVQCTGDGVTTIVVDLGDNNDTLTLDTDIPGSVTSTLNGETGDDEITGGSSQDTINGGDGGDTLSGRTAVDTLDGGPGGDTLNGDAAADTLNGGANDDILRGGADGDTLNGNEGGDSLLGDDGTDTLDGGPGGDDLLGGDNVDTVTYAARANQVSVTLDNLTNDGEAGEGDLVGGSSPINDVENVIGGNAGDLLTGDPKANTFTGGPGADTISTLGGHDTVNGGAGLDALLAGGVGNDTVNADADGAVIDGGTGADDLNGGAGIDTVTYAGRAADAALAGITADPDGQADDGNADDVSGLDKDNIATSVENITGSDAGDTLGGNALANTLNGGPGDDVLRAGAAQDGGDTYIGGSHAATGDRVDYGLRTAAVTVRTFNNASDDGESGELDNVQPDVENVDGGDGADSLTGADGVANALNGGDGADTLRGRTGADLLTGGDGTDTVSYDDRSAGVAVTLDGTAADDGNAEDGPAGARDRVAEVENVTGGSGDDTLRGADAGPNTLNGGDGNDRLDGRLGADVLNGQGGAHDVADYSDPSRTNPHRFDLNGDADDGQGCPTTCEGDNISTEDVDGSPGADVFFGSSQDNTLRGLGGPDDVNGLGGNDVLDGGGGADNLNGAVGDDTLNGGSNPDGSSDGAADTIDGGPGTGDSVSYAGRSTPVNVTLDSTANDGTAGENDDVRSTIEHAAGGAGDDNLAGNAAANTLDGLGGNDVLRGGLGRDTLIGGDGEGDQASYTERTAAVDVTLDTVANDGDPATNEDDNVGPAGDVENVAGGAGSDTLIGSDGANELDGGGDDDLLDGGLGGDALIGGAHGPNGDTATYASRTAPVSVTIADAATPDGEGGENDDVRTTVENLVGGSGSDTLTGDDAPNRLDGGPGIGDDTLTGGLGHDVFIGGNNAAAGDTISYSDRATPVAVSLDGVANDGPEGENAGSTIENVTGGSGDDTLTGGPGANVVTGGAGNDTLDGAAGPDRLNGGTGSDTATYADRGVPVSVTLDAGANDGATGEGDNVDTENVTGGTSSDTLTGDGSANALTGAAGADTLAGGAGDDTLDGGLDADTLTGGGGTDTATYADRTAAVTVTLDGAGNDGNAGEGDNAVTENVVGGVGDDTLSGSNEANVLSGGIGNDAIALGDGVADIANCGAGTDTATLDQLDAANDCESVSRSGGQVTTTPTPTTTTTTTPGTTTTPAPGPAPQPQTPPRAQSQSRSPRRLRLDAITRVVRPSRDRRAPYRFTVRGDIGLPAQLEERSRLVCGEGGLVSVQTKVGSRTVSTRRTRLRRDCSYSTSVAFRDLRRLSRSGRPVRLKLTPRFLGNRFLLPLTGRSLFVRVG